MNHVSAQMPSINMRLAQEIEKSIRESDSDADTLEHVQNIVFSEGFQQDPISYLVNEMIDRGVGRCRTDDYARAFVVGKIPNFADRISLPDFLRAIATERFKCHKNAKKIMGCFNGSLKKWLFHMHLNQAVNNLRQAIDEKDSSALFRAENDLRLPLDIFNQAEHLKKYTYNRDFELD